MLEILQAGKISISVEYKRVKTMRLTVYPPDGQVRISAPMHTDLRMIQEFVLSRLPWIEKHREKMLNQSREGNSFTDGEIHHIWGQPFTIKIVQHQGYPKVEAKDNQMLLFIKPGTEKLKKTELLEKWYHAIIRKAAPRVVAKWEPVLGVEVKKIFYRKMKTHWGSCNYGQKTIRLNTELAKKSPEFMEYVILHEMIHIIEPAHNRNFYKMMERYCPKWKDIRKKMNQYSLAPL